MLESIGKRGNWLLIILKLVDWRKHTETSIQTLYVYSTLKRRGNGHFQVVSTWNKLGVFVGIYGTLVVFVEVPRGLFNIYDIILQKYLTSFSL